MMAWASSSCPGVQLLNSSSLARSPASCFQAEASSGASVESAGSASDTSHATDKVDRALPAAVTPSTSAIPRYATPRHDAGDRVIVSRSVFLSLHLIAQIGNGGEKHAVYRSQRDKTLLRGKRLRISD